MTLEKLLPVVGLVGALALPGCAGAGLTLFGVGAGVTAGTAVDHTLSGVAYKTFTAPMADLHGATLKTIDRMAFKRIADEPAEFGRIIKAKAEEREILIELERLTPQTTRMRVTADRPGSILRDRSTATEIIVQTAYAVDEAQHAATGK